MEAMLSFHNKSKEEKSALGAAGRKHVLEKYGMDKFSDLWVKTVEETMSELGSWETRKGYKSWEMIEIK